MKKIATMSLVFLCLAGLSAQAIETTIYVAEDTSASYVGLKDSVTWHGNYCAANVKTFWKFALAELAVPPGCIIQINSANFRLHGESSYGNNLPTETVYQVLDNNWTAGNFTIDNAPALGPALGSYTYPGGFVSVYIDCKDYLQSVLNAGGTRISFGSQASNVYVDETNPNRFRMIGKTYTQYGIAYTPRLDIDYTIFSNESSEINLNTVPIVQPTIGSVQTPIMHQQYFRGERELFGYNPRFTPSDVSFDLDNRPYIRVGKRADGHDMFAGDDTTMGVIQTTDDNGNWIELNTFLPAIKAMYPSWSGTYSAGVSMDERIVFDSSGDAYMVVQTNRSNLNFNVLLHSKDRCRTWKVYPLSSTYYFTKWEVRDGNNDTDKPPVLMVYPYGFSGGPIYMIVPQKTANGNLILPVVTLTTDPLAYPMPNQSGMGNSTVSKGNLIHAVYMSLNPIAGNTGTPIYAVTYDRSTGIVTAPLLIGISNNNYQPDIHDGPAITIDSQGYLHVVIGAHHNSFKYTKSLAPNSTTSGWTDPINVGDPNYAGWSYVSLLCDKNDTIHIIGRNAGYCYYFGLWYVRRPASGVWEDVGPLVMPFRPYYSNWYHRLSLDRQNRLFLNYIYYGDQYDYEGGPEINAYRAKWPWETIYLDPSPSNRPEHGSWIGLNGHDPCMIMSDNGGNSWRIALSTSLQLFFNNTFDNGLDGWTLTNHSSTNPIKTLSSYTYNGKTLLPRTGVTFAVAERSANWKKATRNLGVPQSGVFAGYMNLAENTDIGMISISTPGHEFIIMANYANGKVWYRIDSTQTSTNIDVTPQQWHKIKFVAGPNGVDAYWDQTQLFHSDLGTHISSMSFGSAWGTAPCGYDDFSFTPLPAVLSVTPETQNVESKAGTATFTVSNTGAASMPWTAEVISGGSWLSITNGTQGTNSGTITVTISQNTDAANTRTGTIRITATGATSSPKDLTIIQAKGLIPGDANGDTLVDVGDLGILAANYGGSGKSWAQGDFNGDRIVDVGDLGILAAHYGQGVNVALDFSADYAKAFGVAAEEKNSEIEEDINNPFCSGLGLPLIMSLLIAGLMLVKLEK
jgi:hypothetical protein